MAVSITAAAQSDIGCVRKNNQDSFGIAANAHVYVVCDGMGGAAGGEVASRIAVDAFLDTFRARNTSCSRALFDAAMGANSAVLARAHTDPTLRGMGSTLVGACFEDRLLHLVNVGDSRAYLVRNGHCTQLTVDHSYLQEQVRLGLMTQAVADQSPMQSVITRAVGVGHDMLPDLSDLTLEDGDVLLLTSDGLTRHISDTEIARLGAANGHNDRAGLEARIHTLIDTAKQRGGSDNITCILLQISMS